MGQLLFILVPVEPGDGSGAFLVGIGFAVVREEREAGIRAWIDLHFGDGLRLMRALHRRSQRNDRAGPHKQRQRIDGRLHRDGLAAFDALLGPVVVPVGPGRQVDLAAGGALFGHRRYQKGRAEHVLVAQIGHLGVVGEIQRQRAHERRAGEPGLVAQRVDVGHQLIAQAQVLFQNRLSLFAVGPDFVGVPAAVGAEDGQKRGVLEPAGIKLRVVIVAAHVGASVGWIQQRLVGWMVLSGQILPSAGVVGPVGQPRSRKIQAGGNLPLERVPGGIDVGRPEDRTVPLRACIGVARQDQRPPLRLVLAEAVIERPCVEEWVDIEKLCAGTDVQVGAVRGQIRLGFVGPQGVEALADNVLVDGLPVPCGGLGIGGVDIRPGAVVR